MAANIGRYDAAYRVPGPAETGVHDDTGAHLARLPGAPVVELDLGSRVPPARVLRQEPVPGPVVVSEQREIGVSLSAPH